MTGLPPLLLQDHNGRRRGAVMLEVNPMPERTQTPVKPETPVREKPRFEPERHYNPERLCPTQRRDGERFSRP